MKAQFMLLTHLLYESNSHAFLLICTLLEGINKKTSTGKVCCKLLPMNNHFLIIKEVKKQDGIKQI